MNQISAWLLFCILIGSGSVFAQEEGPRRDSGGWEYNGVFRFSDKLQVNESSDWNFAAIDILASLGPRYHRYDPIRKSDQATVSSFTDQSLYASLGLEYRFFTYVSLIANWVWEDQEVQRYDGESITNDNPYARENHTGVQLNYDPFYISYEFGDWRIPHYYLDGSFYARRYVDLQVQILRAGFRRKITEKFSLSFSLDFTQGKEFVDPTFGNMNSESLGVNVLLLHSSGFGVRIREEEGVLDSDTYKLKTKAFGIMPFVSLL